MKVTYLNDKVPKVLILDLFNLEEEINTRIQLVLGLGIFGTSSEQYTELVSNSRDLVNLISRFLGGEERVISLARESNN